MVLKQVLLDFSLSIHFNTKNKYDSLGFVVMRVKRDGFGGGLMITKEEKSSMLSEAIKTFQLHHST